MRADSVPTSGTITLVFTDIVGSTSTTRTLGDAAWAAVLRKHNEVVRTAVAARGGREVKMTGDGFMLAFPSARDAVTCALEIQAELAGEPIAIRAGVHTGEAVVEGDDYIGHHVNTAARVMQAAGAGEVLVSSVAREVTSGVHGIRFGTGRVLHVKGLEEPITAHVATADASALLMLGVLGPLRVEWRGQPVAVTAPKDRAVLALLTAAAGQTVTTDRLLDELWPELDERRGRAALQVRISALRKQFDGGDQPIRSEPQGYRLVLAADGLDANRFDALVRDARTVAVNDPNLAAAKLDAALALWRGRAYADVGASPAIEAEGARLDEARLVAIEDRLEVDLACGRHREVAEAAEQLVAKHPLRERAWAALMTALYRNGRQADALSAFQRLREYLVDELGIEPSPQLRALEAAVLAQDPQLDLVAPRPGPTGPRVSTELPAAVHRARSSELVGRVNELQRLQAGWAAAMAGTGGAVFVAGEAGIGKTRLVSELALTAHDDGALVAFARCDEDPLAPYQPVRQLLEAAWRARPDVFESARPHDVEAVATLLPELRRLITASSEPARDDDRYVLFEATASILRAVAAAQPVLLIIDDLQWIDRPSLQLVRHLATHPLPAALLLAFTSRTEAAAAGGVLSTLSSDVDRAGRPVDTVMLGGLAESDVGSIAATLIAQQDDEDSVDGSLIAALHAATQGNPFFVRETVRHLLETGSLSTGRVLAVPDSVRSVVERRLEVLGPQCRQVLEAAAIVGRDFELDLLVDVVGLDEGAVLDALEEAVDARLIAEVGEADAFTFTHPVIRETLDGGIMRTRARRMHATIASTLEQRFAGALDQQLVAIAFHLEAAGPSVSVEHLHDVSVAAAEHAMAILAYEDASRLFGIALRTADAVELDDHQRVELQIGYGSALVQSGSPDGRAALAEAGNLARQRGTAEQLARAVFAASQESVGIAYDDPVFIEMLEDALDGVGPGDSQLRARVLGRLGFELFQHDESDRPIELTDEAVDMARRLGDPATLAMVLAHRRFYRYGAQDSFTDGEEIVALAAAAGDPVLALPGYVALAAAALQRGDLATAARIVDQVAERARQLRRPRMEWWAVHASAVLAGARGDLDASDELLAAALDLGQRTGETNALGFYLSQALPNALLRGTLGLFEAPLADYLSTTRALLGFMAQPLVRWEAGDVAGAAAQLDEIAADGFAILRADSTYPACLGALAEAVIKLGAEQHVAALRELLEPLSGELIDISAFAGCLGPVDRFLGGLAATGGLLDVAVEKLEAAVALCTSAGSPRWLERSRLQLATVLEQRNEGDDVRRASELREGDDGASADS